MTIARPRNTPRARRLVLIVAVAGIAAGIDLTVKAAVSTQLASGQVLDWGLVSIQLVYNPGVAFSLGATLPSWVIATLTGTIIVALGGYLISRAHKLSAVSTVGGGLLLGGALGNFIDRLDGRGVVDYLHTGWFATFNLADVFVTIGVTALALGMLLAQKGPASTALNENTDSRPSAG